MHPFSGTIAIFRRYGLTIEKTISPLTVNLVALLGASEDFKILGAVTTPFLLFIESMSIYLNVSPDGLVLFIGLNRSFPFSITHPLGKSV